MTGPSEIKPREGDQPASLYKDWVVGAEFPPLPFTITTDVVREYMSVVDADPANYVIDGRQAAPPNVVFVYMMAVILVFNVANTVFNTALYVYADKGRAPTGFSPEVMRGAFQHKD